MDISYTPHVRPEFEELMERIHPPRVCIDNDSSSNCSLVKVDSANKHGMLLEIVQVLTDLHLVISKSYISSDGGWLMDVFHVTDQQGKKITDENLIHSVQEGICASRRASRDVNIRRHRPVWIEHTALEMTGIDRPGLLSEMSAVLTELDCHVSAAVAWTHNKRVASIIYLEDGSRRGPITDPFRVAQIQAQLENVIEAHHNNDEPRSVRLAAPAAGRTHTERRLHQLMAADKDYEDCCSCCDCGNNNEEDDHRKKKCYGTHVKIEKCRVNGYLIATIRCRDRPKLLFDTVCTLTDLEYVVFHAAISSKGSIAFQEYYVRPKDGYALNCEGERQRLVQCLIAATERRISHGLKLDLCTKNRTGLLSDVTRVFRENGLTITQAEIGLKGENAVGTFYVKDVSGQNVSRETLEIVSKEIGGSINVANKTYPDATSSRPSTSNNNSIQEIRSTAFSLGNMFREQLERISRNFKPSGTSLTRGESVSHKFMQACGSQNLGSGMM